MLKTLMPNLNCKGNIGLESSCAEIVLAATKCNEVVYQMYFAPKKYKDVFERFYKAKSAGKTLVPPGNVGTNIVVGDISVLHCDEHTDEINIKDERYNDVRKAIDTVFSCYSDD
jgi:hypothetical protein